MKKGIFFGLAALLTASSLVVSSPSFASPVSKSDSIDSTYSISAGSETKYIRDIKRYYLTQKEASQNMVITYRDGNYIGDLYANDVPSKVTSGPYKDSWLVVYSGTLYYSHES